MHEQQPPSHIANATAPWVRILFPPHIQCNYEPTYQQQQQQQQKRQRTSAAGLIRRPRRGRPKPSRTTPSGAVAVSHLDHRLTACYDHHREFLIDKKQVVLQPETLLLEEKYLKNLSRLGRASSSSPSPKTVFVSEFLRHRDARAVKDAIESTHLPQTNRGYSRKPDGMPFRI